jgi:hypothetical protein
VRRAYRFEVQVGYVWHELKTGNGPVAGSRALPHLKAVKGRTRAAVYRAARVFMEDYEGPGAPHLLERQQHAWQVFRRYRTS